MAFAKGVATKGYQGMVGGTLVFRKVGTETLVCAAPVRGSKAPSINQIAHRERFKLASYYATRTKHNPELLAEYQAAALIKGIANVRVVMMADYFSSPTIVSNKLVKLDGPPETQVLKTVIVDYMRTAEVTVSVTGPAGTVLETGPGVLSDDTQTWTYAIQDTENLTTAVSFDITAINLPGNETTQSFDYQAQ